MGSAQIGISFCVEAQLIIKVTSERGLESKLFREAAKESVLRAFSFGQETSAALISGRTPLSTQTPAH